MNEEKIGGNEDYDNQTETIKVALKGVKPITIKKRKKKVEPKCICKELIKSKSIGWCPACKTDYI